MTTPERKRRIAWRCRRGMLELDSLLARILDGAPERFDDQDWESFEALLGRPDMDILALLSDSPRNDHELSLFNRKINNIINENS